MKHIAKNYHFCSVVQCRVSAFDKLLLGTKHFFFIYCISHSSLFNLGNFIAFFLLSFLLLNYFFICPTSISKYIVCKSVDQTIKQSKFLYSSAALKCFLNNMLNLIKTNKLCYCAHKSN